MLGGLLAPHADDAKIGVGAGPWNETQPVFHRGQPLGHNLSTDSG